MAATPKPISLDDIITEVEHVFADHIRRPPLAHEVAAYNQVHAAFEHLKERIVTLITGKPASAPTSVVEPAEAAGAADQDGAKVNEPGATT